MECYYIVYRKNDVIKFINDVVLSNGDIKKHDREKFVRKHLALNYPNVSSFILNEITML